jgi:hypothetical protein
MMERTAMSLNFSRRTFVLAVTFLDHYINSNAFFDISELNTYAVTALLLAGKSAEKDERVPFINKLIRYSQADVQMLAVKRAELTLCDFFKWHLQYGTVIDLLNFYLNQGIYFAADTIISPSKQSTATANSGIILQEQCANLINLASVKDLHPHKKDRKRLEFDTRPKTDSEDDEQNNTFSSSSYSSDYQRLDQIVQECDEELMKVAVAVVKGLIP